MSSISVVMPVFNAERYLHESIDSILSQTFSNYELIIIDDGSFDKTIDILRYYSDIDTRIRILQNPKNQGIAYSLNNGISIAKNEFIVRADSDDYLNSKLFEYQHDFMTNHPSVTLCGCWIESYETSIKYKYPIKDPDIRAYMLFNSPFAHPTVIFRKKQFLSSACRYDSAFQPAEDYDLWTRLAEHSDVVFANIPKVLYRHRDYPGKDRTEYVKKQISMADVVRFRLLRRLGLEPDEVEKRAHGILSTTIEPSSLRDIKVTKLWTDKIMKANQGKQLYNSESLSKEVKRLRHNVAYRFIKNKIKEYI